MNGCRALTLEEKPLVASSFNSKRDRCLFLLGVNTGFRISELLSIRIKQVLNIDYLSVKKGYLKGKNESRTIILNNEAKQAISDYLLEVGQYDMEDFLFKSREGDNKPIDRTTAHRILKAAFSKANLTGNLATHTMRKTLSEMVYEKSGHDLVLLQKVLGHSNIMTTIKYLSVSNAKINKILLGEI